MKRTGFKPPTMEKIIAARSKPRKALKASKLTKAKPNREKKVKVHWKPPAWFMAIPAGSHGSNPVQKRLWKLTSDYVRIFDAEKYGVCASCDRPIGHWSQGDCGHYKAWSVCNVYFKFARVNLAWQCGNCNRLSDGNVGYNFSNTLIERHGKMVLTQIESDNRQFHGGKFDNVVIVQMARELIDEFQKNTVDKPEYWDMVIEKLSTETFA